jgi:hypothetical protein
MSYDDRLTVTEIKTIFAEEVAAAGGTVSDSCDDGARLFTRSILPLTREVLPKDRFQGGVALRATEREVCVHPYVFRRICTNGSIRAHAIQTVQIGDLDTLTAYEAEVLVREGIRACSAEEAFTEAAAEIRSAREAGVDLALNMMPLLSRLPHRVGAQIFSDIMDRFKKGSDSSRVGLMNAVTSVARDTPDPELRWRLEEFGGGIVALPTPAPVFGGGRVKRPEKARQPNRSAACATR